MAKVTAVKGSKNKKRVNVFIDGTLAFTVTWDVAVSAGLRSGILLSQDQIDALKESETFQRCIDVALNYLSYRPRSETEVRRRLYKHRFKRELMDIVVDKLKKQSLLNDVEFAKYWRDNRNNNNPRSRLLLKKELRQKGVSSDIINEVVQEVDEEESAYRAALKKKRTLSSLEFEDFRSKLFGYLKWRGFGYGIMDRVCDRLWHELTDG